MWKVYYLEIDKGTVPALRVFTKASTPTATVRHAIISAIEAPPAGAITTHIAPPNAIIDAIATRMTR
jgi:hypothetical protein